MNYREIASESTTYRKGLGHLRRYSLIGLLVVTVWVVRHRSATRSCRPSRASFPARFCTPTKFPLDPDEGGERPMVLTAGEASYAADQGVAQTDQRGSHHDLQDGSRWPSMHVRG